MKKNVILEMSVLNVEEENTRQKVTSIKGIGIKVLGPEDFYLDVGRVRMSYSEEATSDLIYFLENHEKFNSRILITATATILKRRKNSQRLYVHSVIKIWSV